MELNITGQKIDITPSLKEYINQKIPKLTRHFEKIMWMKIILKVEKNTHIAEAKMHAAGHDFFAQAEKKDMYTSIDGMISKLDAQILKYKNKRNE
jgi:putative sigma-54 modulation protein